MVSRNWKFLILFFLIFAFLLTGCEFKEVSSIEQTAEHIGTFDTPAGTMEKPAVKDALLYRISDGESHGVQLEFNVIHSAALFSDVRVSGYGLNNLSDLAEIMGTADAPNPEFGTSTTGRTLGKAVLADLFVNENGEIISIVVTDIRTRPVVGISWKKDTIKSDYQGFAEAFERNGAYAVYLPQVLTDAQAQAVLREIDGIFMTGGEDLNPSLYSQSQTPHGSVKWNDTRDVSDLLMIRHAIDLNIPLLAVCRGAQALNVALGGSLIQDIPYYLGQQVLGGDIPPERVTAVLSGTLPGSDECILDNGYTYYNARNELVGNTYNQEHDTYLEGSGCENGHLRVEVDGVCHKGGDKYHSLGSGSEDSSAAIDPTSKWLVHIIGDTKIDFVSTAHHQAVDPNALGDGLTIVARSSDGIVEAIEYQANLFALGLQWHPERDALCDSGDIDADQELSSKPLRALVYYAGIHQSYES